MALNIDRIVDKTVKKVIYIDDEESCEMFENRDQMTKLEIVFTDNTCIKVDTVSGYSDDWIEIIYKNK